MPPKAKAAPAGKSAAKSSWENELVQVILSGALNVIYFCFFILSNLSCRHLKLKIVV